MDAWLLPKISEDTSGSFVTAKIFFHRGSFDAFVKISFTSSAVVFLFAIKVISTIDPAGTGTRIETPSNNPFNSGKASVTAIAAPVEEGTIFWAAALPSRRSFLLGPSTSA